ncbi:MAG: DNA-binding helix-turn-helix protein [Cytophagaceae bacterium]|jgi:transcriptional regulator with XRE-family HTH domain|nr:DNA-binding helix-turn-helix protein [Cytophagaceae bacterium]
MKKPKEILGSPIFDEILNEAPKDAKLSVTRSLAIAMQIIELMDGKGLMQKDLAEQLGKSEAEISKWLSGFHNFTINTIVKIETALDARIITTPKEVKESIKESINDSIVSELNKKNRINFKVLTDTISRSKINIPLPEAKVIALKPHFEDVEVGNINARATGTYSS